MKANDAQGIELKERADNDQQPSPSASSSSGNKIYDTDNDDQKRPKAPQAVRGDNAHVVEQQDDANRADDGAPDDPVFKAIVPSVPSPLAYLVFQGRHKRGTILFRGLVPLI